MNKTMFAVLAAVYSLSAGATEPAADAPGRLEATSAASDQATDSGYALYRRTVLGDVSVMVGATTASRPAAVTPGPYARYLMHNGVGEASALEQARSIGELPAPGGLGTESTRLELDSYERYQVTVLGRGESEIRRERAGRMLAQEGTQRNVSQ